MLNKRTKNKTNYLVSLLATLGIIVLINFISVKNFFRIDLTEDKIYTLSPASKSIIKKLDDPLIVKVYFTKQLPPPYSSHARYLKDQLDEFKAISKGKFTYEFIDPSKNEDLEKEVMMMGIPPVQIQGIKDDKFEATKAYMGLAINFEDRKEIIPVIQTTVGLEYEIISRIKKVLNTDIKKIGFLTGHGEPSINEDLKTVSTLLKEQYNISKVDLSNGKPVPNDLDTLIIAGPNTPLTEAEKFEIDQFLMKGKTIAFFLDAYEIDIKNFRQTPINNNLNDLLSHYGVKVNNDLILDMNNKRIQVQQNRGFMTINNIVNYPFIPVMRDFDKKSTIVGRIEGAFFPFVSSLELLNDMATPIIKSSKKSWTQKDNKINTNPLGKFRFDPSNKGPYVSAAVISGEFESFYKGKEIPKSEKKEEDTPIPLLPLAENKTIIENSPATRILVIGDSDFIKEGMLMDRSNIPFIMNAFDWLAQDEALISIRSRGATERPLEEVTDFKRKLIKVANIFLIPIILAIFGFIRWRIRLIRKREVWT